MKISNYISLNNSLVQSPEQFNFYQESSKFVHKSERIFLTSPLVIHFYMLTSMKRFTRFNLPVAKGQNGQRHKSRRVEKE